MRFREDETVKGKEKKKLWKNDEKEKKEETKDNKSDVKGSNESAVKRSIVLMKRRLCFRITAKLRNSKRQVCSWQERKQGGAHCLKKTTKNYYVSIRRAIHMLRGLNIDSHFRQKAWQQKKPNNIEKVEKGK